ncbi:MAG: hypothetical protein V3S55_14665 [Nitrospiraceae bacterium]
MTRRATRHGPRRAGLVSGATADDWLERAIALAEAGRSAEARKAALRALKAEPGNTAARHVAGLLELQDGRATKAVQHLRKAAAGWPCRLTARLKCVCVIMQSGRFYLSKSEYGW